MGYIKLHPADREKYGAPERIPFDFTAVGVRQRAALERETKKSYRWLIDQLEGVPELDEAGNPIPVPVLDDEGKPVLNEDGTEKVEPKLKRDGEAIAMFIWMMLWGAGVKVPWSTFDIRDDGLEIHSDGEDGESGKGDQPETDSASTTTDPS